MVFDWDPEKHEANLARPDRGFGFDLAALIFDGETIEAVDDRRNYGEVRIRAIGAVDGLVLHVVYTDRDRVRRIISARKADREERKLWQER